jgi:hypothetical protein
MGQKRKAYKHLVKNIKEKDHVEYLGIDGSIV